MLTGPPPKFHGTRDILCRDSVKLGMPCDIKENACPRLIQRLRLRA
jgi:hypothetical protein